MEISIITYSQLDNFPPQLSVAITESASYQDKVLLSQNMAQTEAKHRPMQHGEN